MNYKKALNSIVEERREQLNAAKELYRQAICTNQPLYEMEKRLRELYLRQIHNLPVDDVEIARLEKEKLTMLEELGVTKKRLNPPPKCKKCSDFGIINGKYCDCVKRRAIAEDDNLSLPLRHFSDSDGKIEEENGLMVLYGHMRTFIEKFPNTNTKNIVLLGSAGTGKTFLASILAGEVAERGFSVMLLTSFALLQKMLAFHTSFSNEREEQFLPLIDCDLLVIDDLGTESMLKNVTIEYLYIIINERCIKGHHTVITSNLSMSDIALRYGKKIESRLFDKNNSLCKVLDGADLRKQ